MNQVNWKISRIIGCSLVALSVQPVVFGASVFTLEGGANFGSDPVKVQFTLEDLGADIKFTIDVLSETVNGTNNIGDLRGVFFDISNDALLPGLSVSGTHVTDQDFDVANVINLGGGVNLNGDGNKKFDAGVEIGTSGIGANDIQSTMFTLTHASVALDLSLLDDEFFGARLTSVGPLGSGRSGSSKLKGPQPSLIPPPTVPTPSAAALACFGVLGLLARRRK